MFVKGDTWSELNTFSNLSLLLPIIILTPFYDHVQYRAGRLLPSSACIADLTRPRFSIRLHLNFLRVAEQVHVLFNGSRPFSSFTIWLLLYCSAPLHGAINLTPRTPFSFMYPFHICAQTNVCKTKMIQGKRPIDDNKL